MRLGASLNVVLAAMSLFCAPAISFAEDAISAPAQKTIGLAKQEIVPSLIVLNSAGATLQGTTLTLTGVSPNSIVFADRPVRSAGHSLTAHLLEEWDSGSGSFDKDPPNATVSVLSKDASGVGDAVVVLKDPKMTGDKLTFTVEVLEGDLKAADGPAAVFIDIIGLPRTPLSFAGAARRTAFRGAWYRGAAVGAAVGVGVGAAIGAASRYPYPATPPIQPIRPRIPLLRPAATIRIRPATELGVPDAVPAGGANSGRVAKWWNAPFSEQVRLKGEDGGVRGSSPPPLR